MKKKKWLAILLAAVMVFTLIPTAAFAAGEDATVSTGEELSAAFEKGGTIILGNDITYKDTLVLKADTVLDLNGHTLTHEFVRGESKYVYAIYTDEQYLYDFTLRDSSQNGTGKIISNQYAIYGSYDELSIEGGTISGQYTAAPNCSKFTMSDGVVDDMRLRVNGNAELSGGTSHKLEISVNAVDGQADSGKLLVHGNFVSEGSAVLSAENGVTLSGNAKFNDGITINSAAVIEDNVSIVVSNEDGYYSRKINFGGSGNVTINGGYFEAADRHFLYCDGGNGRTKQFVINGGTFYLKSSENWTYGLFYYCTPVINGGVFKTDGDEIKFGNSWNAAEIKFNGGYFEKPLGKSNEGDNHIPNFQYPSNYSFSSDTLGSLTGDTGEYQDYYWITKSTDVTYNVNNDASGSIDTQTYKGKAYTTYASGSMTTNPSSDTYTLYNSAAPYRAGYQYSGWSENDNTQSGTQIISGLSASPTVYAAWKSGEPSYSIQYDLNGGTGNIPADIESKSVDDTVTVADGEGLSYANYTFAGWSLDPEAKYDDAEVIAENGSLAVSEVVSSAQASVDADGNYSYFITLYAVWKPKTAITFENQTVGYTGKPIAYDVTKNSGNVKDNFTVTYYSDYQYKEQITDAPEEGFTEPGYYYVIVERPEDETYAEVYAKTMLYVKPLGSLLVSASRYDEMYDGNPHSVDISIYGGPEDKSQVTVKYTYSDGYVADPEYTLDELPTWTDVVNNMNVYVQVSAPGYMTVTSRNSVTITKADKVQIVMDDDTVDYDGNPHSLDSVVQSIEVISTGTRPGTYYTDINGATPTLTYYTDAQYQNAIEGEPVDAGVYYVKAVLEETTNYAGAEAAAVLTIEKTENQLAFENTAETKHISDDKFIPKLNGSTDRASFNSSNTAVATVDESTGEITIVGSGTTDITVSVPESNNYEAATAVYTLTVTPHEYGEEWITDKQATCGEAGSKHKLCTLCNAKGEITEIPALDHNAVRVEPKQATCMENGNIAYWHCDVCDGYFSDESLSKEITKDQTIVKAAGHHIVIKNAKEATCTEEGYTGDKVCKVCGEVTEKGTVAAKIAHSYKDGKCSVCGAADPGTKPTDTNKDDTDSPKTGESSNMALWISLLFVTGTGLFGTAAYSRKKKAR